MDGAVLTDEDAAVDIHYLVAREGTLELAAGFLIVYGLAIGWHQNCAVYHEEIRVGGRQPVAVVGITDGIGHRERIELTVMLGGKRLQLLFHKTQVVKVRVGGVGTLDVGYGSSRAETCQRIYVPVGVVALEVAVG